jgi:hypothetical protein
MNGLLCGQQIVFEILVKGLIGLEAGPEMQQLKHQFQEFIVGLMSLPIKLPGTRLYRSLQVQLHYAASTMLATALLLCLLGFLLLSIDHRHCTQGAE